MISRSKAFLHNLRLLAAPVIVGMRPVRATQIVAEYDGAAVLDATMETLHAQAVRATDAGITDLAVLHNLGLYVCIFLRDQGLLKIDALRSDPSDRARSSFIARQWVVLLWDVAKKLKNNVFNSDIRDTLGAIAPTSVERAHAVNKAANDFWKKRGDELTEWRNVAAAHRDFDAPKQLGYMQRIELHAIMEVAAEFVAVTSPTLALVTEVLLGLQLKHYLAAMQRARERAEARESNEAAVQSPPGGPGRTVAKKQKRRR